MHNGKYVLAQLLDFIDKDVFLRISNKYNGNRYVKDFTCWNQLAVMVFGQLSNRESLRDVVLATQAHASKAFHLGFGKYATRSNLSKANANRDYRIFEEFAYRVVDEARRCRAEDIFKLGGKVYAFDSTTIELCLETFKWAIFRKNQKKGGIKVHTLYDLETQIPTFFHITEARVHDMNAMDVIPYEENAFYIFDLPEHGVSGLDVQILIREDHQRVVHAEGILHLLIGLHRRKVLGKRLDYIVIDIVVRVTVDRGDPGQKEGQEHRLVVFLHKIRDLRK